MLGAKPTTRDVQLAAERLRQAMAASSGSGVPGPNQPSANPFSPATPTPLATGVGAGAGTGTERVEGGRAAGIGGGGGPARGRTQSQSQRRRETAGEGERDRERDRGRPVAVVPVDPPPKSAFRKGRDRRRTSDADSTTAPPTAPGPTDVSPRPDRPPRPTAPTIPAQAPTVPQPTQSPPRERAVRPIPIRTTGPTTAITVSPQGVTVIASPTAISPTTAAAAGGEQAGAAQTRKRDPPGRVQTGRRPGASPPLPSLPSANSLRAMSPAPQQQQQPPGYDVPTHPAPPGQGVRLVSGSALSENQQDGQQQQQGGYQQAPPGWPTSPQPLPPMERYPDNYFPMPDVGPMSPHQPGPPGPPGQAGGGGYQPVQQGYQIPFLGRPIPQHQDSHEPEDGLPQDQRGGGGDGRRPPKPKRQSRRSLLASALQAFTRTRPARPSPLQQVQTAGSPPHAEPGQLEAGMNGHEVRGYDFADEHGHGSEGEGNGYAYPRPPGPGQPHAPVHQREMSTEKPSSFRTAQTANTGQTNQTNQTNPSAPRSPRSAGSKRPSSGGIMSLLRGAPPDPKLPPTDGEKTVEERMEHTIKLAEHTYNKQVWLERFYAAGINLTILLQLLFAAAITVLSAVPGNHSIPTAVLGALTTLLAGLLARYRGTNQPERAGAHATAMRTFLAECEAFIDDYGDKRGAVFDAKIAELRAKYEVIEENAERAANGVMHAGYEVMAGGAGAKFHS